MNVEEYTECFGRAVNAADIAAIGQLDSKLRLVVESEISKINGDIIEQRKLAEKLEALNELYKTASLQFQRRREAIAQQNSSIQVAREYQKTADMR